MGDRLAERAAFWWLLLPIVFGLLLRALRRPAFFHRYVGEATPASLAAIRVLTCAILLAHVMVEDLASTAWLPRRLVEPMGVLQLLYALPIGFRGFLASPAALSVFKAVTAALLLAGAAGWRARATLPLAALGYLIFGGILRHYSAFYHAGLVPLYVLAVLVFTPCVDAWSIDRRRRASRGLPVPEPGRPAAVYGWSRYACWTVVALAYAASGLSKLRNGGLHWWDAANVRAIYYRTSLNPMHFDWGLSLRLVQAPDALFALLGLASVALEVGFLAVLFWRPARRVLPLLMILFHVAVLFLENLLFLDLVVLQAIFFDFAEPGGLLGPGRAAGEPRPPAGQGGLRHPALVAAAASVVVCAWITRIEFYPLTAMQMFSWRDRSGVVEYYKVLAQRRSGAVDPAALRHCTYRTFAITPVVKKAFDPAGQAICREYLAMCAARGNRRAADPIARFEIQRWRWDLRHDRAGEHVTLVDRYVQDVP